MKTIKIILFATLTLNVYCQQKDLEQEIIEFIGNSMKLNEQNPTHLSETNEINSIFKKALIIHKKKSDVDNEQNIDEIFKCLYKNSISLYEDSQDEIRYKTRRALCLVSIALISDSEKAETFINYAKLTIAENDQKLDLLEDYYLSILILESFYKYENGSLSDNNLDKIKVFLRNNKESITPTYYEKSLAIINKFKNKLSS